MPDQSAPARLSLQLTADPVPEQRRADILSSPGFGVNFTDHMVLLEWTPEQGWHAGRVEAYGPLLLDPATAVLHYAQEVFEGLKAYAHDDGSVWTFRPEANAARMQRSAERLALPQLPADLFLETVDTLVTVDRAWVPYGGETSLYLRPFMFASEAFLGVRPARHVTFCVIASPAGSYFPGGVRPVSIWLSETYARAGRGGTGAAKTGGNYASSLLPQQEAIAAGCDQVAFLDAVEHKWVEELGGMNLWFVHADGHVVTPELSGTILEGVTRDSVLAIAADLGLKVEERRVAASEWREGVASGEITEVFACGTAAVITPIGMLRWNGGEVGHGFENTGEVTTAIRSRLLDLQYGRAEDPYGWLHRVC